MPAWEIKKLWDGGAITGYRNYVAAEAPKKTGSLRSTCEDLALRLVTEYAEQQGLPILFKNGANSDGVNPRKFKTVNEFLDSALTSTGARDLVDYNTVLFVPGTAVSDANSLRKAQKGDLIILYNPIHHVQVVVASSSSDVKIAQGNFRSTGRASNWDKFWGANQNRPTDQYYIGEIVAENTHSLVAKTGEWMYNGKELFKDDSGRLMIWDFDAWNKLIEVYTVQGNDSLSKIATKVLNDGNLWTRIYDNNKAAIGPDSNKIKAGQKLYIWKL